jgi:hypothetical protein
MSKQPRKAIRIYLDPDKKKELHKLLIDRDMTFQKFFESCADRFLKREKKKREEEGHFD